MRRLVELTPCHWVNPAHVTMLIEGKPITKASQTDDTPRTYVYLTSDNGDPSEWPIPLSLQAICKRLGFEMVPLEGKHG